jgi:hypothetical protein
MQWYQVKNVHKDKARLRPAALGQTHSHPEWKAKIGKKKIQLYQAEINLHPKLNQARFISLISPSSSL